MTHSSPIVATVILVLLVISQKRMEQYEVVEVVGKALQGLLTVYIIGYVVLQAIAWSMLG